MPGNISVAPAFSAEQLTAEPTDAWVTNGGTLANQRYSPLDQIDTTNVGDLKGAWMTDLGSATAAKYSAEGQPVVYDGVIYVPTGDDDVFVYDKEPGRGTREVLNKYIYGDEKAPPPPESGNYAIVGGNLETRNKLESTPGAVAPLSTSFVEGRDGLAAVTLDGIEPSPENIASGKYPMARPLYLITDGKPEGSAKKFVDYVPVVTDAPLDGAMRAYLDRRLFGSTVR